MGLAIVNFVSEAGKKTNREQGSGKDKKIGKSGRHARRKTGQRGEKM